MPRARCSQLQTTLDAQLVLPTLVRVSQILYLLPHACRGLRFGQNLANELVAAIAIEPQTASQVQNAIGIFDTGGYAVILRKELGAVAAYRFAAQFGCHQIVDVHDAFGGDRKSVAE